MERIAVHGSGYVGLATAACLAEAGFSLVCVETDPDRLRPLQTLDLAALQAEDATLAALLRQQVEAGRLRFTADAADAVAPVAFVCVGTPAAPGGEADLSAVHQAAQAIGRHAAEDLVVFVKSTVPPGTCADLQDRLSRQLAERPDAAGLQVEVVSNPEFLRQGKAVEDFRAPDRVMIGAFSERGRDAARQVFEALPQCRDRLIFSDPASAELAKCAANAFLAARVAMINDFALLADLWGADIEAVRRCVGADPRIGPDFLAPGCGFGGSCFGKDLQSLDHLAGGQLDSGLFRAILRGNEQHKRYPVAQARDCFGGSLKGLRVAVWGLAFKQGTTDTRESPALAIIGELLEGGAEVRAHDPALSATPYPAVEMAADALAAADGADALILCTDLPEFAAVDLAALHQRMRRPLVIDSRNLFDPALMQRAGFEYRGTGRRARPPEEQ